MSRRGCAFRIRAIPAARAAGCPRRVFAVGAIRKAHLEKHISTIRFSLGTRRRKTLSPWNSTAPIREALFGEERLAQHARSLAGAQPIAARPSAGPSLAARLKGNARRLLQVYEATVIAAASDEAIAPAAEWLLDNYHLVDG